MSLLKEMKKGGWKKPKEYAVIITSTCLKCDKGEIVNVLFRKTIAKGKGTPICFEPCWNCGSKK